MPRGENDATVIGVSAAVVYDVISATNSSPQTTEINAKARAETLMKWVNIGLVQALLFVGIMTVAEPPGKKWRPLAGGGLAAILLYYQYLHARAAGLASGDPGTETYQEPVNRGTGRGVRKRGGGERQRPPRYEFPTQKVPGYADAPLVSREGV